MNKINPSLQSISPLSHQQGYIGNRPALALHEDPNILAHALDEIACGVIIVDASGQVQHCNLAGQVLLQRGSSLREDQHRLQTAEPADAPRLLEALAKAAQGKRSMLTLGKESQTTVAFVPLDRHHDRHTDRYTERHANNSSANAAQAKPIASARIALIFSRTGMCEALMMSFFARAYSLTRSEEQILSLLCVGHTAPEMAEQLRVGEATVRTHIRSICQKTHSNGIREVVKRLALLPPLMAAVMPGAFA
jgi:DNA-binding CsgD family transcriptional regulator